MKKKLFLSLLCLFFSSSIFAGPVSASLGSGLGSSASGAMTVVTASMLGPVSIASPPFLSVYSAFPFIFGVFGSLIPSL